MTIDETSAACGISKEKLEHYIELGLLVTEDDLESSLRRLCAISTLVKAGMTPEKIAANPVLLDESAGTLEERVRIMKKERFRLLDDIHARQQSLDCLDCIIRELKKAAQ